MCVEYPRVTVGWVRALACNDVCVEFPSSSNHCFQLPRRTSATLELIDWHLAQVLSSRDSKPLCVDLGRERASREALQTLDRIKSSCAQQPLDVCSLSLSLSLAYPELLPERVPSKANKSLRNEQLCTQNLRSCCKHRQGGKSWQHRSQRIAPLSGTCAIAQKLDLNRQ